MRKNLKFAFLAIGAALALSSCSAVGSVPLNYDDADLSIETEWTDYTAVANGITFAEGQELITINKGESYTYEATVSPNKATLASVNWESSDDNIVTVSNGTVTAINGGSAAITVSAKDESFDDINLNVNVVVPVERLEVSPASLELDFNEEAQLTVGYVPGDTTQQGVTFTSLDETICTVSDTGLVTAKKLGNNETKSTKIVVSSPYLDASKNVEVEVTVTDKTVHVTGIKVFNGETQVDSVRVEAGKNVKLDAEVVPSDATYPAIGWTSNDPSIVTVTEEGLLSALVPSEVASSELTTKLILNAADNIKKEVAVQVFEVIPHSVDVLKNAFEMDTVNVNKAQIEVVYKDEGGEVIEPSAPSTRFTVVSETPDDSSAEHVIELNANGEIKALNRGTAVVNVTDERYSSLVAVPVSIHVVKGTSGITLSKSSISVYPNDEFDLVATVSPSDSDMKDVTFEITSGDVVIEGLKTSENTFHVLSKGGEGNAVITASVGNVSASCSVKVTATGEAFMEGSSYIVGQDATGTKGFGDNLHPSWDDSRFAFKFIDKTANQYAKYEWHNIVTFNEGDEWKIRDGSTYRNIVSSAANDEGSYDTGKYKITEGAFASGDMEALKNEDDQYTNVKVNTAGEYDVYYAFYENEHPEGWYEVYVQRHVISFKEPTASVVEGQQVEVQLENWDAATLIPNVESSDVKGLEVINVTDKGVVTLKGWKVGEYIITATDASTNVATCKVEVVGVGYYVVGSFTNWKSNSKYLLTADSKDTNHFYLPKINLSAGDKFKILHTDGTWLGNNDYNWDGRFGTDADGNVVVQSDGSGSYALNLYVDSENGNHIVINDTYMLHLGRAGAWSDLPLSPKDDGQEYVIYYANLLAGDIFKLKLGNDWRGFDQLKPSSPAKDEFKDDESGDNNFEVLTSGLYHIYVKKSADEGGDDKGCSVYIDYAATNFKFGSEALAYTVPTDAEKEAGMMAKFAATADVSAGTLIKFYKGEDQITSNLGPNKDDLETPAYNNYIGNRLATYKIANSQENATIELGIYAGGYSFWISGGTSPNHHESEIVRVYFSNNKGWGEVYAYAFESATKTPAKEWPGEAATYLTQNKEGEAVYYYDVELADFDAIIFNNNKTSEEEKQQTKDISLLGYTPYTGYYCNSDSSPYDVHTYTYGIEVSKNESKLLADETDEITVYTPVGDVMVSSDDSSVATVSYDKDNAKATITAKAIGTTIIHISDENSTKDVAVKVGEVKSAIRLFIQDETDKGWIKNGVDPVAHIWNVTFVEGSPYASLKEMREDGVNIGMGTGYEEGESCGWANIRMCWIADSPRQYDLVLPWYIKSVDVCFYATEDNVDRYLYNKGNGDAYQLTANTNYEHKIYICSKVGEDVYDPWWDGSKFRSNISAEFPTPYTVEVYPD